MRDILIRWLGIYHGQIDAYQHIHDAIGRGIDDADSIKGLCNNMISQIRENEERDQAHLNEIDNKENKTI